MPRSNYTMLRSHARKMVYDVYCYMEKEARTEKDKVRRTAESTKTSERTVRRIVKEGRSSGLLNGFKTPGKKRNRKRPITEIDTFDQSVIRSCVHEYITNKELPSVETLRKKLKDDINYMGSEKSLRTILKNLGFQWLNTEYKKRILIEKSEIRFQRIEYLQTLIKYREEGRPIVYSNEFYIDSHQSDSKALSDGPLKGVKKQIPKDQRVVIVHAASEAGFLPKTLFLFKTATMSGDFHDSMDYNYYTKWLCGQLIPNLPPNAVFVIDNTPYHNKQYDPAPNSTAKKEEMQSWLVEKGVAYEESMLKPQLYNLIKLYKSQHKKYIIDEVLAEHNHSVLRLPPFHPDLNPIEMAWASIKSDIASNNTAKDATSVTELIKEKVSLMDADEWSKLCEKVKKNEIDYIKSDHVVDTITDNFIIYPGEDSDSSSSESDDNSLGNGPMPSTSSSGAYNLMPGVSVIPSDSDDEATYIFL